LALLVSVALSGLLALRVTRVTLAQRVRLAQLDLLALLVLTVRQVQRARLALALRQGLWC
jgi:hypothetical protein